MERCSRQPSHDKVAHAAGAGGLDRERQLFERFVLRHVDDLMSPIAPCPVVKVTFNNRDTYGSRGELLRPARRRLWFDDHRRRQEGTRPNVLCRLRRRTLDRVRRTATSRITGALARKSGGSLYAQTGRRSAPRGSTDCQPFVSRQLKFWLRGRHLNPRPLGYNDTPSGTATLGPGILLSWGQFGGNRRFLSGSSGFSAQNLKDSSNS